MIKYNIRELNGKTHPKKGERGIIRHGEFIDYPVTIVDNHQEVDEGGYTGYPALCLLHLNENVRQYKLLHVFKTFNYVDYAQQTPTYRMYDYAQTDVSKEQAIEILQRVLYCDQPELEESPGHGWDAAIGESNTNYCSGRYVLNDEEDYLIQKHKERYWIYKGRQSSDNALLFEGPLNQDLYRLSMEVAQLRRRILKTINHSLDGGEEDLIPTYRQLHTQLKERLKTETK